MEDFLKTSKTHVEMKRTFINTTIAILSVALIYYLHYLKPVAYVYLIAEDYWGEYATFVCYLVSFLLLVRTFIIDKTMRKPGYILFALAFFFIGFEEISWGQRIFGIETPYAIAKYNVQSELTIHNFFDFPMEYLLAAGVLAWAIILPVVHARSQYIKGFVKRFGVPMTSFAQRALFIPSIFFLFFFPLVKSGEIGELLLSVAFMLYSFDVLSTVSQKTKVLSVPNRVVQRSAMFAFVVAFTAVLVTFASSDQRLGRRLNSFATRSLFNNGQYVQADKIFQYILDHPKFMREDTLYRYGQLLKEMESPKAEEILTQALAEQRKQALKDPDNAEILRITGKILNLLSEEKQALVVFQEAIKKDVMQLTKVTKDWEKAEKLLSLGETYYEMGEFKQAIDQLNQARDLAPNKVFEIKVDELITHSAQRLDD